MKIIKQEDISNWKFLVTCKKCNSELEAEKNDVKHHHYEGDRQEAPYDSFHVVCPVCSNQLSVPEDKMPKRLKIEVMSKAKSYTGSGSYFDR